MKKNYVISVIVRTGSGYTELPVQECENLTIAEAVLKGLVEMNPDYSFMLERKVPKRSWI